MEKWLTGKVKRKKTDTTDAHDINKKRKEGRPNIESTPQAEQEKQPRQA